MKLLQWLMPVKNLAALIFAGLMCGYMAAGALYSVLKPYPFNYTIPLIFLLQGLGMSIVTAVLWTVLLGDDRPHKARYLPRLVLFGVLLVVALSLCFLNFFALHTDWAKLWLIVAGVVLAGVAGLSVLGELYFRATGRKYTALLRTYQEKLTS